MRGRSDRQWRFSVRSGAAGLASVSRIDLLTESGRGLGLNASAVGWWRFV